MLFLNTELRCCNNFALSLVDKVTAGEKRFISVPPNAVASFAALDDKTQFPVRLILRLISDIARVPQKIFQWYRSFNILCAIATCLTGCLSLNLNESAVLLSKKLAKEPSLFTAGSSLQYCHKLMQLVNS